MKKNKGIFIALAGLVLIAVFIVVSVMKKPDSDGKNVTVKNDEQTEISSDPDEAVGTDGQPEAAFDGKTITFAVPEICSISEEHLKLFNDALQKDGYHYRLKIDSLIYDEYANALGNALKSGEADIAFLGLGDADGSNNVYNVIQSGLVYNLDEILQTDQGKKLYDAFPESLWEAVKCNKHIYSIPTTLLNDQGLYAAFNKDYISDKEIDEWDGSLKGLYKILKGKKWDDNIAPRFQYLLSGYSFENMINCEIRYDLLFDYDTLTVENPLESKKFADFFRILDKMKKDGYMYMDDSISYMDNTGLNNHEVLQNIKSGNYLIALDIGAANEAFIKDNIKVRRLTPYLSSRINGSIGISKHTDDIDAVVDFLGLLYGNEKYGNILLYGKEDEDYKVMNGTACKMDGTALEDSFIEKVCLDLFLNIHPAQGEDYTQNRKEEYFSFYDSMKLSPFIGFEPDTGEKNPVSKDMDEFMEDLKEKTVDEAISHAKDRLKSDGMEEYLASVRHQWEEYQK